MKNREKRDTEAQPLGYLSFFVGLIIATALWIVLQNPIDIITGKRSDATANIEDSTRQDIAEQGADLFGILIDNALLFIVVIGVFGLIAYTVYLRRGQGV
jgi:beta-lactamase regulating signal transducer with metallopeptidase domain